MQRARIKAVISEYHYSQAITLLIQYKPVLYKLEDWILREVVFRYSQKQETYQSYIIILDKLIQELLINGERR